MDSVDSKIDSSMLIAEIKLVRRSLIPEAPFFALDVSLNIPSGITVLFGPSGSGKSTLLDCIAGLLNPDQGRIAIGADTLFDSESRINLTPQARRVAYVFQTLALFPHMTAEENVAYGLADLPRDVRASRVAEILKAFGVEKVRTRKPAQISGGERQRIALARSLVTQPRALLLDEPLTGLDAHVKAAVIDDLRVWNVTRQIPILLVTHSRDEVVALGERVIALDRGRVVSEGTPLEVLEAPRRKRLAQAAGFENFLTGIVVELREADGVMRVRLADSHCEIEVPLGFAVVGDRVCIAVRAGDILLATEPPRGLSARNVFEGKIASLENKGTLVEARVVCGSTSGANFLVHVTPGAARALDLVGAQRVWLVLKTHSCHLVEN
jgi:molybdate transport system ATP-binding protein